MSCAPSESLSASVAMDVTNDSGFDAKVFRHNFMRSTNYNRRGFGHEEETLELMSHEYNSKFYRIVVVWLSHKLRKKKGLILAIVPLVSLEFQLCPPNINCDNFSLRL